MYLVVRQRTTRAFRRARAGGGARHPPLRRAASVTTSAGATASSDWWRHSFRKVCLRAEPREWEAVRELDHERVGDVACLPPVRRCLRDRVLVRMQALSDEAGPLPPPPEDARPGALTLVVATDLGMSAGKSLAQIGHAALMADLDPELDVRVVGAGGAEWERLASSAAAVVRDGGLTELAPGSETVLVLSDRGGEGAGARVLIVNPFASGVSEARLAAVAGGAAGRNRDGSHAGARRRDRARGRVVAAGGGDLRLLGRRDLQRGDQRPPRRRSGRVRPRRRHECPARARSACRATRSAQPSGSASAGRGASPSAASTAAVRVQRRHRARRRARPPGRRARPPRGRQAARRPRLRAGRRRRSSEQRFRYAPSRSRSRGSAARRSRSSRTARRTPTPGASGCGSRPTPPSRAASTRRAGRRSRRGDPAARGAGPSRPPAPRTCPARPRPRPDRDPLRRPAARAGRRRGHRRPRGGRVRRRARRLTVLT